MKRSGLVLLLLMSFTLLRATPSFGESCPPRGVVIAGGQAYYDHIANGEPASTACWSPVNVAFVSNLPACSIGSPTYNAFQFTFTSSATQQFTIPANFTNPNFSLTFFLDFIAPHRDGYDLFRAQVVDVTPPGERVLAEMYRFGDEPDLHCARIDVPDLPLVAALAGHTLQVRFYARRGWNDTIIRVSGISFFQKL